MDYHSIQYNTVITPFSVCPSVRLSVCPSMALVTHFFFFFFLYSVLIFNRE